MAKMWPRKLPFDIIQNPFRSSEVKVYRKFETELENSIVVFYSRPWLGLTRSGEEIDGECDFVVADPQSGILAIEVKGGSIAYDPETGTWTSIDRMGFKHRIKNPVEQAKSSKYMLLEKLKKAPDGIKGFINIRHCVIFPDSSRTKRDLAPDLPLEIVCFYEDFENRFAEWIKSRLDFSSIGGGSFEPLGKKGIHCLESILARPFHLRTPLGHTVRENEREMEIMTQQQYHILGMVGEIPRVAIAGSAGTGKTVLAIEQSLRLAESGMRTLFTCFNRSLAEFVRERADGSPLLTILNFHRWCLDVIKKAGIEVPVYGNEREFFEEIVPELTIRALESIPEIKYDAIVVDEGQDFQPLWWPVLEYALSVEKAGLLRVFYDDNQRVYGIKTGLPGEISAVPIRLSYNLRNTQRIHNVCKNFYSGSDVQAVGPLGSEVEWITANSEGQASIKAINRVKEIIANEAIVPEEIAILVSNESEVQHISEVIRKTRSGLITCRCDSPAKGYVVLDTIRRFKGLERPIIVLLVSSDMVNLIELVYVGLTRARTYLVVIGELSSIDRIRAEVRE